MARPPRQGEPPLPRLAAGLIRKLLPIAEREEVLADLRAEFAQRRDLRGRASASVWIWRQALGSVPALFGRGWWRGMTGFEPHANRMRPGGPMFESWIMDFRYAVRRLTRRPAYAALAILTLALGAGGTAAVFSIVRTLLIDPLPIARESQVGVFWFSGSWSEREFLYLRPNFPGFQRVGAYRPNDLTLDVPGQPLRLAPGVAVSSELFDTLGSPPFLGRTFRAGEDAPGAELVVVLSHSLWQELGSDPAVVGQRLQLGGLSRTVVGVMPRGFWFPSPKTRVWTAAQMSPQNGSGRYTLVGRIADGMSMQQLDGPMKSIATALGARFPYPNPQWDKTKAPAIEEAREFFVGDVRASLVATLAAMGVILLIACANVAALMLGQVDARSTEIAVRAALGANRQRLVQQLLLESLAIGVLAGVAGAALATLGFELLVTGLPLGALADNTRLDWTVFWGSIAAALVAAVLIAVIPGIALWRGSTLQATMATSRTGGVSGRGGRLEGSLVVAQMALAVLLAAGAGLLLRSVANLRAIDPGVDVDGIAIVGSTMPSNLDAAGRRRAINEMVSQLRQLPGVTSVAAVQRLPLMGSGDNWGFSVPGRADLSGMTTAFRMVTHDYFQTVGLPIRRGRNFAPSDREGSERAVIINEAMAAKVFPGADPIGRTISTGFDDAGERVVGIVANAAEARLTDIAVPARYMVYEHVPMVWHHVNFTLRVEDENNVPATLDLARSTIARAGTQLAVQEMTSMKNVLDRAVGPAGQVVTLVSLLAGLALVLGAVGVYGVISHYVTRRSRDYGIRLALGQTPSRVVRDVVARGAGLVAIGATIGLVAALWMTKLLSTLLHGVRPTDPLAFIAAVVVLLVVGVLAAFVPARRASLTDPVAILRE